jgi:ABC-2 type transport system permease protein
MKSMVASGNSRMRIYFAKLIVFSIGAILISLILPIFMTGSVAVYLNFRGMPELGYFLRTNGFIVLYAAALASIMALFSTIFTDSGKTIGFLLMFFILIDSILYALSSKFSFFEPVFNYSVFKLAGDISQLSLSSNELLKLVIIPIVTFVVIGIVGGLGFQKKEIK